MIGYSFIILLIAIVTACLSELTLYLLVYRTEHYKKLKLTLEKQAKKLEKKKESAAWTPKLGSNQKKKLEKTEEKLQVDNREINMIKMKSMVILGFTFTALLGMFNQIFDAVVVARLPFEPIPFLQGITHRNLMGSDMQDCSFIFLYILSTMAIRENLQKLSGFGPSRAVARLGGSMWQPSGSNSGGKLW